MHSDFLFQKSLPSYWELQIHWLHHRRTFGQSSLTYYLFSGSSPKIINARDLSTHWFPRNYQNLSKKKKTQLKVTFHTQIWKPRRKSFFFFLLYQLSSILINCHLWSISNFTRFAPCHWEEKHPQCAGSIKLRTLLRIIKLFHNCIPKPYP